MNTNKYIFCVLNYIGHKKSFKKRQNIFWVCLFSWAFLDFLSHHSAWQISLSPLHDMELFLFLFTHCQTLTSVTLVLFQCKSRVAPSVWMKVWYSWFHPDKTVVMLVGRRQHFWGFDKDCDQTSDWEQTCISICCQDNLQSQGLLGLAVEGLLLVPWAGLAGHVLRILHSSFLSHCCLLLWGQPQPQCTVQELSGPASSSLAHTLSYP